MEPTTGQYFDSAREDVYAFVPESARSFLDVGCSLGGFGEHVRQVRGPSVRIVGVEPHDEWADVARSRGYDEVLTGLMPDILEGSSQRFDCIVFNDVLEHMLDPWEVVRRTRDWLTPTGVVVASIPSIAYLPVVYDLVRRGRWDYTDEGTLDRTHVRFFTRPTMVEMFESSGFRVESATGIHSLFDVEPWQRRRRQRLPKEWGRRLLGPLVADRQWLQFVIVAKAS